MKKVIALIVSIIMAVSMVMPVFAARSPGRGIHINSGDPDHGPGTVVKQGDPLLDNYLKQGSTGGGDSKPGTKKSTKPTRTTKKSGISMLRYTREDGIEAVLILTPYDERQTIIYDKSRSEISQAHAEIQAADGNLEMLSKDVSQKAKAAGVNTEECYVSEIFDLTYYLILPDYVQSDDHGKFQITVGRDKLKNFVCLLHRYNGVWRVVTDAAVTGENEDILEFSTELFSPFAVVVWGDGTSNVISPKTSDDSFTYAVYAAGVILSMVAVGYVLVKGRKRV